MKFANGHFNLAAAYANQRKFDATIQEREKVIALDPKAQDAKDMLNDLKEERVDVEFRLGGSTFHACCESSD